MANYADSVWGAALYKLDEAMQKPEFKHKPSTALTVMKRNSEFMIPTSQRESMWNQKSSDSQTVTIKSLEKQTASVGSAREYNHTGAVGDSGTVNLSYSIYSRPFKYSLKRADYNVFSQGEMIGKQILSAAIDLHSDIETAQMAYLNTNKTQVVISASPQSGEWDATNYLFGVLNADKDQYFQWLKMFMKEQYYAAPFDVINNIRAQGHAQFLGQQGQGNATNLGWQIDGMDMGASSELANATGYDQMSYIIPQGGVGLVDWIPALNRLGHGNIFQNGGQYSTMPDPLGSGMTFAVHQYATGVDNDGAGSETQDVDIQVELSVDIAPFKAPMSTTNLTPIIKAGLLQ